MNKAAKRTASLDQAGLVSIIVTVVLMLVISMITLTFAKVVRREQRQTLDRHLNSQAFYAAETGVNDARKAIDALAGAPIPDKKGCALADPADLANYGSLNGVIDPANRVTYSCLLISSAPLSLAYDLSSSSPTKVVPIISATTRISSLELSWTSSVAGSLTDCGSANATLPQASAWACRYAMMRVDLARGDSGFSRGMLMGGTFTAFLKPVQTGGSGTIGFNGAGSNVHGGSANQGALTATTCSNTECKMTITGLSDNKLYLRVGALYRNASLKIVAKDSSNNPLSLTGAQVLIDSTGKANDVLRRIQVRVPTIGDGLHADYGIQSNDSLCKMFVTYPDAAHPNTAGCL